MQSVGRTCSRCRGWRAALARHAEWTLVQSLMQRAARRSGRALSALLTQNQQRPHAMRFPAAGSVCGPKAGFACRTAKCLVQPRQQRGALHARRWFHRGAWLRAEDGSAVFPCMTPVPALRLSTSLRLTERFTGWTAAQARDRGTGLALAIVKHVLQRHGATLDIASTLARAQCFQSPSRPTNRLRVCPAGLMARQSMKTNSSVKSLLQRLAAQRQAKPCPTAPAAHPSAKSSSCRFYQACGPTAAQYTTRSAIRCGSKAQHKHRTASATRIGSGGVTWCRAPRRTRPPLALPV